MGTRKTRKTKTAEATTPTATAVTEVTDVLVTTAGTVVPEFQSTERSWYVVSEPVSARRKNRKTLPPILKTLMESW